MRKLLSIVSMISLFACPALAWDQPAPTTTNTTNNNPTAHARSNATGGTATSSSRSHSNATGGTAVNTVIVNPGTGNGTSPAGGSSGIPANGTIVANPWANNIVASAIAPGGMSYNACAGSPASGAVQTGLFGLSIGSGGGFDNACRLHMLGQDAAAMAYLCRVNKDVRASFRDIGRPCPQDQPVETVSAGPPDYCFTRDADDRNQHRECDHWGKN